MTTTTQSFIITTINVNIGIFYVSCIWDRAGNYVSEDLL